MHSPAFWRRLCLASTGLFLLTGLADRVLSGSLWLSSLLFGLPLILMLLATVMNRLRLLQWLGFVLMLYFIVCVLRLFMPGLLPLRLAALAFCVIAFVSAMLFINRFRKHRLSMK